MLTSRPITRLLVANRGEIASRIFRTCHEMGIATVAVYADPDATLPFVRQAGCAVGLGGSAASESYLVIDKILDAARRSGADAIHPGFGFLSENASFAQAVLDAGLTWVGPTPANIAAMGTKVEAKQLAAAAGVPVLPSAVASGDSPDEWLRAADVVGYPILVKASSGGGGKGMRIVTCADELADAVTSARREAASSFGDPTVFLERYLRAPRHIEVQVFGDTLGNVVHLFERECSIQRRHQKIVEEAPSPVLSDAMRSTMTSAAVSLAESIGYVGAGTVEFLYDIASDGREVFYFLEMNTRLQVEHPVTEAITGFDLVRWQINVANGVPLPVAQSAITRIGAAIEVRLYAEDPSHDFLPTFGVLHAFGPAGVGGVRYDAGVETGSEITTYFDPMIAKIITHASTRHEAAARLRTALQQLQLHGPVTNRDYLAAIMNDDDYLAGNTTTAYVDEHRDLLTSHVSDDEFIRRISVATMVGSMQRRRCDIRWGFVPAGFRNVPSQPLAFTYLVNDTEVTVRYSWTSLAQNMCALTIGEVSINARIVSQRSVDPHTDEITADLDGVTCTYTVRVLGRDTWVNGSDGQSHLVEIEKFADASVSAGSHGPIAPVPGRVVAVHVVVGASVKAGDVLVVMEAMKMEHRIAAPSDGVVQELFCAVGEQVDAHQVLVSLG